MLYGYVIFPVRDNILYGNYIQDYGYRAMMTKVRYAMYHVIIALWIGGMVLFTFIVAPAIFRHFGRDTAGSIMGKLFAGYFMYNLVLSVVALILLIAIGSSLTKRAFRLSLILVISAVIINSVVTFKLHPEIRKVKQRIPSFEMTERDSPLRKEFGRLHAVSATLNLILLAEGVALLVLSSVLKKQ